MAIDEAAAFIILGNIGLVLFTSRVLISNLGQLLTFKTTYNFMTVLFANFLGLGLLNYALAIQVGQVTEIEIIYTAFTWYLYLLVGIVMLQFLSTILMSVKQPISELKFK